MWLIAKNEKSVIVSDGQIRLSQKWHNFSTEANHLINQGFSHQIDGFVPGAR